MNKSLKKTCFIQEIQRSLSPLHSDSHEKINGTSLINQKRGFIIRKRSRSPQ